MYIPSWGDSAVTGDARIDAEHRQLYLEVDQLLAAMNRGRDPEAVQQSLSFLADHVRNHFREEERLHRMVEAPGFEAHAAAHRQLTEEVEALVRRHQQEGLTAALELHLLNSVIRGFIDQIHSHDVPLARHMQEQQQAMTHEGGQ